MEGQNGLVGGDYIRECSKKQQGSKGPSSKREKPVNEKKNYARPGREKVLIPESMRSFAFA